MKPLKGVPLTPEEELEICKECNGFCCRYYFHNAEQMGKEGMALHTFRKRKIIRYGNSHAVILSDTCPYSDCENKICTNYKKEGFPKLCLTFPHLYRPFWNLKCKLMRVRYARRLIPKDILGFSKLKKACKPKETFFRYFKK